MWSGWQAKGPDPPAADDFTMHNRQIQKLASDIASSASEDQLFSALSSAASRLGFDHFALAYDRRGASGPSSLLIHDYPESWAGLYVKLDLGGIDPVRRAGERSMTGFGWRELDRYIPLSRGDRRMLEVGREHGLGDGFTVPRHLPGEASGACSFAIGPQKAYAGDHVPCRRDRGRGRPDHRAEPDRRTETEGAAQAQRAAARMRAVDRARKTAGETAAILGISEETVIQHLKVARDRYDVHCRQMLILCALFDGLIGFSDIYDWWHD